jgi:hypothetical protein
MTLDQVDQLRQLDRAAPPCPWKGSDHMMALYVDKDGQPHAVFEPHVLELALAARNALPRLLDEREMLLAAVRRLSVAAQVSPEDWAKALLDANRAVAFAEGGA